MLQIINSLLHHNLKLNRIFLSSEAITNFPTIFRAIRRVCQHIVVLGEPLPSDCQNNYTECLEECGVTLDYQLHPNDSTYNVKIFTIIIVI
jgi:hypothetical protein